MKLLYHFCPIYRKIRVLRWKQILTQPDRPAGRGRKLRPNPVKQWAITNDLKIRDPQKPGTEEVQWFKELEIEFLLVMAYGHILNSEFLNVAPKGCFNLHASLLPAYRGAFSH